MSELCPAAVVAIDHNDEPGTQYEAEQIAAVCGQLVQVSMDFAAIERVPRYCPDKRENNAEHSFMLALVATELARQFRTDLDHGLVTQFSMVHDLPELRTGDVATFTLDAGRLQQKEQAEAAATEQLVQESLPPYIGNLLLRYEVQQEPEARFVRLTDKILPVKVDTLGPGRKVMTEDYGIYTSDQLDEAETRLSGRLRRNFADSALAPLHLARDILAREFADTFAAE